MLEDYLLPTTVEAALIMLKEHAGQAKLIAGGTDLVLMERKKDKKTKVLVDVSRIHDLQKIVKTAEALYIGAGVTYTEITASPLVQKHAPALAAACAYVGGKQIRNIATLGGNIVTAQPAADGAVACIGLGGTCLVQHADGTIEEKHIQDTYIGVGLSNIDPTSQLLTHIKIPLGQKSTGSSYQRMEQRKALSLPMLCVAVKIVLENDLIAEANIAYGPAAPGPQHAAQAEDFLRGKKADDSNFVAAAELAGQHAVFRSSPVRGSQEFRNQVFPVCVARALREATNLALAQNA